MNKLTSHLSWKTLLLLLLAVAIIAVIARGGDAKAAAETPAGAISAAELQKVVLPTGTPEQTVEYHGYTVSYNPAKHMANYSAWELIRSELQKEASRSNKFYTDPDVCGCATPEDYKHSGYDRGHLAPAADMSFSREAMEASFSMANITPQHPQLNQRAWRVLEENCRRWADIDSSLIIICGPVLSDATTETIGATCVPVPQRFFKVILAPYANPPRAIGFIMNNGPVPGGMQAAAVSVDEVEAVTGMDFFSALPDDIENKIEAETRFSPWFHRRKIK